MERDHLPVDVVGEVFPVPPLAKILGVGGVSSNPDVQLHGGLGFLIGGSDLPPVVVPSFKLE
jgi:hypothetical protein